MRLLHSWAPCERGHLRPDRARGGQSLHGVAPPIARHGREAGPAGKDDKRSSRMPPDHLEVGVIRAHYDGLLAHDAHFTTAGLETTRRGVRSASATLPWTRLLRRGALPADHAARALRPDRGARSSPALTPGKRHRGLRGRDTRRRRPHATAGARRVGPTHVPLLPPRDPPIRSLLRTTADTSRFPQVWGLFHASHQSVNFTVKRALKRILLGN